MASRAGLRMKNADAWKVYSSPGRGRQAGPEGAPHPILHPRSHHLRPSNSCVALTPTPRLVSPPHTYVVPWSRGPLRPLPQSVCPSPCNYFSRAAVPQSPSATIGWRPLKTGRVPAGCLAKLPGREGPSVSRPPALTTAAVQQGTAEEGPAGQRAGPSTRGRLRPHHTDLLLLCPARQPGQTTVTLQRVPAQVSAGGGAGSEGRCGGHGPSCRQPPKPTKLTFHLKLDEAGPCQLCDLGLPKGGEEVVSEVCSSLLISLDPFGPFRSFSWIGSEARLADNCNS